MMKRRKLVSLLLAFCICIGLFANVTPKANAAARKATSTSDVVSMLSSWKSKLNGKYWNYYDREKWNSKIDDVEKNLKAVVNNGYLDASNPTDAQLGVTSDKPCTGSLYPYGCKSNYFGGGYQCWGFASFIEYALFQSTHYHNPNEWIKYSGNSLNSITLQPGDYLGIDSIPHYAVISNISNGKLYCVECLGGSKCIIVWSEGFNQGKYKTTSSMMTALKDAGGFVYRYKGLRSDTERPEKPVITGLASTYTTNDSISIKWTQGTNTTHCNYWLYYQDGSEWKNLNRINYASSPVTETLGAGNYRVHIVAYNSNYWENDGSDWVHTFSDYAYFTVIPAQVAVTCLLNGGSWPNGVSDPSGQYKLGSRISLPTPVRTGYKFVGWNVDLVGSGHLLEPWGVPLNAYPSFSNSMGDVEVYNNYQNGTVTVERVAKTSDCPTSSPYMLKVRTAGEASPWNGGFCQPAGSKASGVFYHVIVAKIPVGNQIETFSNAIGDNSTITWLTPQDGTGRFETYIYKVNCGATGTFSSFGFVALKGRIGTKNDPLTWYVGYSEVFDGTGVSATGNTYTVGNGGGTLSAMWREKDHNVDIQLNGGEWPSGYNDPSGEYKRGSKIVLATPERDGYDFAGWALTYEGDDHVLEPWGVPQRAYPSYGNSMENAEVYNNYQNGNVTVERVAKTSDCPTSSSYMLKVRTAGEASPFNGGFCQPTSSKASGVFYHVIVAKIPVGNQIETFSNAIGDNSTITWLTPQDGTGQFETYIYKVECGATGTFSSFGYVALKSRQGTESNPLVWYVGYSEVFEGVGVDVYNNFQNGTVTLERVAKTSDCPTSSPYMLKVTTAGSASPHNGGFCQPTISKASSVFYHVIVAKIPVGNQIETFTNAIGDGAVITWLTPQDGTGQFETYIYKVECGATGTFSSFGFVSLKGRIGTAEEPLVWYVGYSAVFDGTGVSAGGNSYTVGSGNGTLTAMWRENCSVRHDFRCTVSTNPTTGKTGTLTGTCVRCGETTTITLPKLNKTDYTYVVIQPSTCSFNGTACYTWNTTEYGTFSFNRALALAPHSYEDVITPPSCTAQGYTTHTCTVCGTTITDSETPALDHAWNSGVVTKQPTATQAGVKTFTCTRCGQTRTEAIPPTGPTDSYTVIFKPNQGSGSMDNQVIARDTYEYLTKNTFTRTGYTFSGWNTKANGTGDAVTNGKRVKNLTTEASITLYAQWKPNTYTVKYSANGGTGTTGSYQATYGTYFNISSNAFTRAGYVFSRWNDAADGSGTSYSEGQQVRNLAPSGTKTLYAQWMPNTYTVVFSANGGTGTMGDQSMTYGVSTVLTANAFTRTGYSFTGWNTKSNGSGTAYSNGKAVKNLATGGTVTLYAQWKPNTYTIRYNANGGTGSMTSQPMTYGVYDVLTSNVFTRNGYTFNGWNTKADGSGTAYTDGKTVRNVAASGIVTLYAQWKPNTYTVKFNANGGSGSMANQTMTYGVSTGLRTNGFTRTGYTFSGWNTMANGSGTAYSNGRVVKNLAVSGTVTLYAQWKPNTYTIKYSANGGTGTMSSQTATYNQAITLRTHTFTRTGYTFNGWNTAANGSGTVHTDGESVKNLALSGTVTLYAQWTPNPYTIVFNANGGTGSMARQAMTYGVSAALPANTFTRTGYTFGGWNTKADGSGTSYSNGYTVKNVATGGTVTLYAKWKPNVYSIKYNSNGGTGTMAVQKLTYDVSAALTSNTFTRTGYTFTGWNTAADGSGTAYTNGKTVLNLALSGTVTLYAQWKANTYTVKFYSNGGTGTMSNQTMTYNVSSALRTNAFTRSGYTFTGWNTAADGSGTAYTNGKLVKNLATSGTFILYAQWKKI